MGHWVDVPWWEMAVFAFCGSFSCVAYDWLADYIYKKRNKQ